MNIYLFIQDYYRALSFGVGSYINQLTALAKNNNHISFTLIHLHSRENDSVFAGACPEQAGPQHPSEKEKGCQHIWIPGVKTGSSAVSREKQEEQYLRNVAFLLKEIIPDSEDNVFHFQFMDQITLVTWIKKLFTGKIMLTVHYTDWGAMLHGDKRRLGQILSKPEEQLTAFEKKVTGAIKQGRESVRLFDRMICISSHSRQSFRKCTGIEDAYVSLVPNARKDGYRSLSEEKKLQLRHKYHFPEDRKIVLFAGRLDEAKGIASLIKTFGQLLGTHPEMQLVLAGEGNFNAWMSIAGTFWSKVTFTGRLQKKNLYDLYQIADMGIVCSVYEEFGLVAAEMMMHRLPIIVTDTGGLAEIVDEGVTGLKIPVRTVKGKRQPDAGALYDRMKWMLEHPDEAKLLGKQARRKFLKQYEYAAWKDKMLNIYNNI